jgi:hypothetical protein
MGQLVNHTSFQFNGTVVDILSLVAMTISFAVGSSGTAGSWRAAVYSLLAIIAFLEFILLFITGPAVMAVGR